jgi:hypothetical protein
LDFIGDFELGPLNAFPSLPISKGFGIWLHGRLGRVRHIQHCGRDQGHFNDGDKIQTDWSEKDGYTMNLSHGIWINKIIPCSLSFVRDKPFDVIHHYLNRSLVEVEIIGMEPESVLR